MASQYLLLVLHYSNLFLYTRQQRLDISTDPESSCADGLVENVDRMVFNGYIVPDGNNLSVWNMSNVVFQMKTFTNGSYGDWKNICSYSLYDCLIPALKECSCNSSSDPGYTVRLAFTPDISLNKSLFRLSWPQSSPGNTINSLTVEMPTIWQPANESIRIGNTLKLLNNSTTCRLAIKREEVDDVKYCVRNLESPFLLTLKTGTSWGQFIKTRFSCLSIEASYLLIGPVFFSYKEMTGCQRQRNTSCAILVLNPGSGSFLFPFNKSHTDSSCTTGVLQGSHFYFTGWVNTTDIDISINPPVFEVHVTDPSGKSIRTEIINVPVDGCGMDSTPNTFYCLERKDQIYHIRINLTANTLLTGTKVTLKWDDLSEDTQPMPTVHDTLTVSLSVDGERINVEKPPKDWNLQLHRQYVTHFRFCVASLLPPFRVIMANGSDQIQVSTSNRCLSVRREPDCRDNQNPIWFQYKELKGCYRRARYEVEVVPDLEVNGQPIDVTQPDCRFHWSRDRLHQLAKFCYINLAKPYALLARFDTRVLNSTLGPCLTISDFWKGGNVIFTTKSQCAKELQYNCTVDYRKCSHPNSRWKKKKFTVQVNLTVGNLTYDMVRDCLVPLPIDRNVSYDVCVSGLPSPLQFQVFVGNSRRALRFTTSRCVTFSFLLTETSFSKLFFLKILDYCYKKHPFSCDMEMVEEDEEKHESGHVDHDHDNVPRPLPLIGSSFIFVITLLPFTLACAVYCAWNAGKTVVNLVEERVKTPEESVVFSDVESSGSAFSSNSIYDSSATEIS